MTEHKLHIIETDSSIRGFDLNHAFKCYFRDWQCRKAMSREVIMFKPVSHGPTSCGTINYIMQLPYNFITNR